MSSARLLIIGAGGFGQAVAEAAIASGQHALAGFADDRWPDLPDIQGHGVLGKASDAGALRAHADTAVIAMGNNARREALFKQAELAGFELANVIHPRAIVSATAVLGHGVMVMAGAIVGCEARLADGAIVSAGAIVDHHCTVGRFAQVSAGACMGGGAALEAGAWLQEGCALRPGETVKAGVVISDPRQLGR